MFVDGEPVGHAGDIVAHLAGMRRRRPSLPFTGPFRRQGFRLVHEQAEQLGKNTARLATRPVDPIVPIHALVQEGPQTGQVLGHAEGKADQRPVKVPHGIGGVDAGLRGPLPGLRQHVVHHGPDHPPHGLQTQHPVVYPRPVGPGRADRRTDQRYLHQVLDPEQPRLQAVVHIVIIVGNIVRQGRHLGFGGGIGAEPEVVLGAVDDDGPVGRILQLRRDRAVVLDHPFQRFPGQVQAVEARIAALQPGDDPEGLHVVIKAREVGHAALQLILPRMTEGRMAQVVRQGDGLRQISVQSQGLGKGTGNLRHFQAVGQSGSIVVAFMGHEHLGLFLEPAKGAGMDDAVPVPGKGRAGPAFRLGIRPAPALERVTGIGSPDHKRRGIRGRGVRQAVVSVRQVFRIMRKLSI